MFISEARVEKGITVSVGKDGNEPIRVQFGYNNGSFAIYFGRNEALELMSGLEKAIHKTADKEVL